MKQTNLFLLLILSFAMIAPTIAPAGELGRNSRGAQPQRSAGARPSVNAPARVATAQSNTMRVNNTGADSVLVAARIAARAGNRERAQRAAQKTLLANQHRNLNIANLNGCRKINRGTGVASCYGTRKDGFGYAKDKLYTAVETLFKPTDMSAACDPSLLGKTIVVRDSKTNQARTVVCTDTGAFQSKYGRIIDLASGVFSVFGLRCDQDGLMKSVELYQCPDS